MAEHLCADMPTSNQPGDANTMAVDSVRTPAPALTPAAPAVAAPLRALVVMNTTGVGFYGLERNVIETFEALRPSIEPVMLIQQAADRYRTEMFAELIRRGLTLKFFSDAQDWPRIGKPKSLRHAFQIAACILRGNRDVWKAARDADFVYIPIVTGLYLSFFASAWLRFKRRKVVYSFQDLAWKPSLKLRLGALWVSDFVHLTQRSLDMAVGANPYLARKRNHVIAPVIDLSDRVSGERLQVPATSGRVILFVGQVTKHKGIDVLIEAFCRIAPEFPDAALHIVGGAKWEYGPHFQQVLDATGLNGRIRHWGYVNDVEPLLRSCYVYVHPSLPSMFHESFGRSTVEAMSVGAPVICFRSGALSEIVQHEVTGLICEEESAECLAGALARLLSDPAKRNEYSRNCVRRYQEQYAKGPIQRQWWTLINQSE
jgi:glycosyltransferase involved in cell wall biosynthesis